MKNASCGSPVPKACPPQSAHGRASPAKLLGALGLAQRAGALAVGFDAVAKAAKSGRAALVLLARDVSQGTQKRVRTVCEGRCPVAALPGSMRDMAAVAKKPAGVLAVTNKDLAGLCEKVLESPPKAHEEEPV